jgi:hypothetical protein
MNQDQIIYEKLAAHMNVLTSIPKDDTYYYSTDLQPLTLTDYLTLLTSKNYITPQEQSAMIIAQATTIDVFLNNLSKTITVPKSTSGLPDMFDKFFTLHGSDIYIRKDESTQTYIKLGEVETESMALALEEVGDRNFDNVNYADYENSIFDCELPFSRECFVPAKQKAGLPDMIKSNASSASEYLLRFPQVLKPFNRLNSFDNYNNNNSTPSGFTISKTDTKLDYSKYPLLNLYLEHVVCEDAFDKHCLEVRIAGMLTKENKMRQIIALEGHGLLGKTQFLSCITSFFPENLTGELTEKTFTGDFAGGETGSKILCTYEEMERANASKMATLKGITGGSKRRSEKKGKQLVTTVEAYTTIFMSSNKELAISNTPEEISRWYLYKLKPKEDWDTAYINYTKDMTSNKWDKQMKEEVHIWMQDCLNTHYSLVLNNKLYNVLPKGSAMYARLTNSETSETGKLITEFVNTVLVPDVHSVIRDKTLNKIFNRMSTLVSGKKKEFFASNATAMISTIIGKSVILSVNSSKEKKAKLATLNVGKSPKRADVFEGYRIDIEELREFFEVNEIKPNFQDDFDSFAKSLFSFDAERVNGTKFNAVNNKALFKEAEAIAVEKIHIAGDEQVVRVVTSGLDEESQKTLDELKKMLRMN